MSTVSQTPARRPLSFRARFAIGMGLVALILVASLRGAGGGIARTMSSAHLHAPDMALLAAHPLAVKIHLGAALVAIALGALLMLRRKGRLFHRVAGWVWVSLVAVTAGSTLFITELNHGRWSLLHLFTGWVLLVLPLAVMWAKRHDVKRHRRMMMGLFYGGFAINAFIAFIPGRLLWNMLFG
jgi:uncharacterized membrane protein